MKKSIIEKYFKNSRRFPELQKYAMKNWELTERQWLTKTLPALVNETEIRIRTVWEFAQEMYSKYDTGEANKKVFFFMRDLLLLQAPEDISVYPNHKTWYNLTPPYYFLKSLAPHDIYTGVLDEELFKKNFVEMEIEEILGMYVPC